MHEQYFEFHQIIDALVSGKGHTPLRQGPKNVQDEKIRQAFINALNDEVKDLLDLRPV